jgi:hypothetical protein
MMQVEAGREVSESNIEQIDTAKAAISKAKTAAREVS